MRTQKTLSAVMAAAMIMPGAASAYEPNFQARQMGMGGAGVAAGLPESAAVSNPALLSEHHHSGEDRFAFTLSNASVRASFDENYFDEIDDTQKLLESFEGGAFRFARAVDDNDEQLARDELEGLQSLSDELIGEFQALDNQGLRIRGNAALFGTSTPGERWGFSVTTGANLYLFSDGDIAERDLDVLRALRDTDTDDAREAIEQAQGALSEIVDLETGTIESLDSSARATMGVVAEGRMSLSRRFDIGYHELLGLPLNHISVAITPKYQALYAYDVVADLNDFDDGDIADDSDTRTSDAGANVDLGLASTLGMERQWRVGLMVRDLISRDLETDPQSPLATPRTLSIGPQVSAGLAWRQMSYTLTADVDLNEREGFEGDADQQYLSLGGEYNLRNWVRLRAGARFNIASDQGPKAIEESHHYTAGLELSPGPLRFEASALVGSQNTAGASAEVGLRF